MGDLATHAAVQVKRRVSAPVEIAVGLACIVVAAADWHGWMQEQFHQPIVTLVVAVLLLVDGVRRLIP